MISVDRQSLLVDAPGEITLGVVEADLATHGLTLGFQLGDNATRTVRDWLASGAPGAPCAFADPADHLVAGIEATLPNGKKLEVRPGPRRAVGPDLIALVTGTGDRLARLDRAWLRVHLLDARRASLGVPEVDLDPPVSPAEARLVDAIRTELSK